jgi:hypothetical protein
LKKNNFCREPENKKAGGNENYPAFLFSLLERLQIHLPLPIK